ncbi:Sua5/YciO/YrdC/YwlC family protein, partial [Corynebacterium sp. UMB6689]|nr:Sua5/YciO/YrdC/YwlC family protein [Corynebacterium sp. UMB6689]
VHVCRKEDLFRYSNIVNEAQAAIAKKLTDQFWPGPLTLIVPTKVGIFGPTVTGGLKTVGIRMPDHDFTLAVIRETGFPIVGPSANLSGKPSPT